MADDPRLNAARYRVEKAARDAGFVDDETDAAAPVPARLEATDPDAGPAAPAESAPPPRHPTAHDRAAYVETAIQQAIRRGEFDNLPGAGKPLEGLGDRHDPDWWIRRKIQSEQLTGLGPPALRLRVEHAEFDAHVDGMTREEDVREYIEDFNARVVDARRQLQGGPPVVTPTRDVDAEIARWRERRAARLAAAAEAETDAGTERPRRRWFRRG